MLFRLVFPYSHSQTLLSHLWPHVVVLTCVCLLCSHVQLQHYSDWPFCIYSQTLNNTQFVNTRCSPYLCVCALRAAMYSFLLHCRDLVTEDVIRRMLAPLECALLMMGQWVLAVHWCMNINWGVGWCREVPCSRWDSLGCWMVPWGVMFKMG